MVLKEVFEKTGFPKKIIHSKLNRRVSYASSDSRLVFYPSIFLLKKGERFNAYDFIPNIKDKVVCFVCSVKDRELVESVSKKYPSKVFALVGNLDYFSEKLSRVLFEDIKKLNIIGVTGTNGKTTTSYILNKILNDSGLSSALLSTVKYKWAKHNYKSFMTTLDNFMFKSILHKIYNDGCKYVVSEISSHGLAEKRAKDIVLKRAVFTNLTQDHLDYHLSMENYYKAKKKIFSLLSKKGKAVVNVDDKYGKLIYKHLHKPKLSFGISEDSNYRVKAYRFSRNRLEFLVRIKRKDYFIKAPLVGEFNIYNVLAAVSCAHSLGVSIKNISESVALCKSPPGRLERVKSNIFVDYAHTPAALKEVIQVLRNSNYERIVVVFGCGGDRDKKKRPKMGRVVSKYADYGIITSDNPRSEDPYKICKSIEKGMCGSNYSVVFDRGKAIKKAVSMRDKETAVLIAGKGHESYQDFKTKKIRFSDREFVKKVSG